MILVRFFHVINTESAKTVALILPADANVVSLKGTVAWYGFFTIPTYQDMKIISKISDFRPKLGEMGQFLSFFRSLAYSPKKQKES